MEDLIRAGALLTGEDEAEENFDEPADPENLVDEDGSEEDMDMSSWEN